MSKDPSISPEPTIDVVIPVLNEEQSIAKVIAAVPKGVRRIVVADNGSSDRSAEYARQAGAEVVREAQRGYGAACLRALAYIAHDPPAIVVFLDGDYSDYPEELTKVVAPILEQQADMVIGSRVLGNLQAGALTPQQRVGNAIACRALRLFYGAQFSDLGPFRAIRWQALQSLKMGDRDYGWTVEMQIKASKQGLRIEEVPVSYRARIGQSKVSGTLRGTLGASRKILWLLIKHTRSNS